VENNSDVLVIGTGLSGLYFSLLLPDKYRINIITKSERKETSTYLAQGGISSVNLKKDSFKKHIDDTLRAGRFLNKEDIVEKVVKKGPEHIKKLEEFGVKFTRRGKGYDLHREGGHSERRIFHIKDYTGKAVEEALLRRVRDKKNIKVYEKHMAVNLLIKNKICFGAYVLNEKEGRVLKFTSKVTVLATGGAGRIYLYTSNPDISTGDGIAMAYRGGCRILNMEFIQFHPTLFYHLKERNLLISEALRGEGAVLLNRKGERFMKKYDRREELAPRDVVARAIDTEMKKRGDDYVYLDISKKGKNFIIRKFPYLYKKLKSLGVDMTKEPIPVVPAAHYTCGGVYVNSYGMTDLKNLFAVGEVSCTGLHGANRLASNSLLECLVFSSLSSLKADEILKDKSIKIPYFPEWNPGHASNPDELVVMSHLWDEVRRIMWNYVGIVRTNKRLERAKRRIKVLLKEITKYYWDFVVTRDLIELRNISIVADIVIKSAIKRKESRGIHYNLDYPYEDKKFKKDTVVRINS